MNESRISRRYSKALFQTAVEKNVLDKTYEDMKLVMEICTYPEVKELLESPVVSPSGKLQVFKAVLEGRVGELTVSFVELVIKKQRESFLLPIARYFLRDIRRYKGITETSITTAVKLRKETVDEVKQFIFNQFKTDVELKQKVDKDLIGGFILRIDDNYIDASIKSKLKRVEKELKEISFSA